MNVVSFLKIKMTGSCLLTDLKFNFKKYLVFIYLILCSWRFVFLS